MAVESNKENLEEIKSLLRESKTHRLYSRIRDTIFAFIMGGLTVVSIAPKTEGPEIHHDERITEAITQIRDEERQENNRIDSLQKLIYTIKGLLPPSSSSKP